MNAILIKPIDKLMYSKIIEYIKSLKVPVKILTEREEDDELFINAIEEGMKSGKADKGKVRNFFKRYGVGIL